MCWPRSGIWNKWKSACNAGHWGLIPESGRSPGEGNGKSLHYSCLGNPIDGRAWQATVLGITRVDPTERLNHHHRPGISESVL